MRRNRRGEFVREVCNRAGLGNYRDIGETMLEAIVDLYGSGYTVSQAVTELFETEA